MNADANADLVRVRRLIANGANVHERTKAGETALYEAIERRSPTAENLPIVNELLKAGADPNAEEIFGMHAVGVSLTRDYGNPAVTLLLLRAGAEVPRNCPSREDSLLSLATQNGNLDVVQAMVRKDAPVVCGTGTEGQRSILPR